MKTGSKRAMFIAHRLLGRHLILTFWLMTIACASSNTRGLEFFYGADGPVRWKKTAGRSFSNLNVSTHLARNQIQKDGRLIADYEMGPQLRIKPLRFKNVEATLTSDRGFFTQMQHKHRDYERHIELFRGSSIVSVFERSGIGPPKLEIEFSGKPHFMTSFDGYTSKTTPLGSIRVTHEKTKWPVVAFHDESKATGLLVYFPLPAEKRRWYKEDYTVEEIADYKIKPILDEAGLKIDIETGFEPTKRGRGARTSYDMPVFVMPFAEGLSKALEQFYIDLDEPRAAIPHWRSVEQWKNNPIEFEQLLRMGRYSPQEFSSWIHSHNFKNGHESGYAWGFTTMTMRTIKVDTHSRRALGRDHAFRMLAFFLDAGEEKGAPPHLLDVPGWSKLFPSRSLIYTVVFCQYWEYRLEEFLQLLSSPHLLEEEKERVYSELQRARKVYDPQGAHTWSLALPDNALWFDYFDLPLKQLNPFIVNTHATSINNLGDFVALARFMKRDDDVDYWQALYRRGLAGLLYAGAQDWMWTDKDKNELKYGRRWNGPSSYHKYMVIKWIPKMLDQAFDLAPELYSALSDLYRRSAAARMIQTHPKDLEIAQSVLAKHRTLQTETSTDAGVN